MVMAEICSNCWNITLLRDVTRISDETFNSSNSSNSGSSRETAGGEDSGNLNFQWHLEIQVLSKFSIVSKRCVYHLFIKVMYFPPHSQTFWQAHKIGHSMKYLIKIFTIHPLPSDLARCRERKSQMKDSEAKYKYNIPFETFHFKVRKLPSKVRISKNLRY